MGRIPFHDQLMGVLGNFEDGESHCYFEPPEGMQLRYPCIVYHKSNNYTNFADNIHYFNHTRYQVTIIDEDPDSVIPDRLRNSFLYCSSDRDYCSDGLWHYVYTIYFDGDRIGVDEPEKPESPEE